MNGRFDIYDDSMAETSRLVDTKFNFIQCPMLRNSWITVIFNIEDFNCFSQFRRIIVTCLSRQTFLSSFEDHERMTSRRHEAWVSRDEPLFIMRREKRRSHFPIGSFFFIIIFLYTRFRRRSKFWAGCWKKYCRSKFEFLRRDELSVQHPGPDFCGTRSLAVCAIDPFSLQVSWEGLRTGRYT